MRWVGERLGAVACAMRDALELARATVAYWMWLRPAGKRELEAWDRRGRAIADGVLREHAVGKLTDERLNPEAAALFAILAPRSRRRELVPLIVAYQLLYDYLDAVNEPFRSASLANGLRLHEALTDALAPTGSCEIYDRNPHQDDSAYARVLASTCSVMVSALPAVDRYRETLQRAARRCGQAQAHNHALPREGAAQLLEWCEGQAVPRDYLWWETAAAGISCLAIHALLARAAAPTASAEEAERIDSAYFPYVCGISALLDSLADHDRDARTENHSFTSHYEDPAHATERLLSIASGAYEVQALPLGRRHSIILTGVLAYYLSSPTVLDGFAAPVASSLIAAGDRRTQRMRLVMRLRRSLAAG